jgi:hypothetical protein
MSNEETKSQEKKLTGVCTYRMMTADKHTGEQI